MNLIEPSLKPDESSEPVDPSQNECPGGSRLEVGARFVLD